MLLNFKYNYELLDRITNEKTGDRVYVTPQGAVPSVTTILKKTGDSTGLDEWRAWVGVEKANEISKEATNLGTLVHLHLENYISGIERPKGNNIIRKQAKEMADQIIEYGLPKVSEVWGIESQLYYPELYAGTTDIIGIYDNKPAIMDYKTSKKLKKEEIITDYFIQGSAYALAHNTLFKTNIETVVIFMVTRDNQFQEFVVSGQTFRKYQKMWHQRVEKYYEMEGAIQSTPHSMSV